MDDFTKRDPPALYGCSTAGSSLYVSYAARLDGAGAGPILLSPASDPDLLDFCFFRRADPLFFRRSRFPSGVDGSLIGWGPAFPLPDPVGAISTSVLMCSYCMWGPVGRSRGTP